MIDKKRRKVSFDSLDGMGKLPPQDVQVEIAILGVLLIEKDAFEKVCEILNPDCFYKNEHKLIYKAILELHTEKKNVDILTVTAQLRKNGELDTVGGAFGITQLTDRVASSAHIENHARIITELYLKREIIRISGDFQSRSYDDMEDVFEIIDELHKEVDAIRNYGVDGSEDVPLAISIDERIEEKVKMVSEGITMTGITTGNPKLDSITSGFNKGCLYVFAAAPSLGKSVKGLNYAKIAASHGNRVPVFSLEMSKRDYIDRFICEESKVPLGDYRANRVTHYDMDKIKIAAKHLKSLPISIYDNPSANTNYIRKKIKSEIKRFGSIQMIVVDYAQLIKPNEIDSFSLSDFFQLYEDIFYQIPKEGEIESHRFILEKTTEYLGISLNEETNIQALLNEITTLRQELLDTNKELLDLSK